MSTDRRRQCLQYEDRARPELGKVQQLGNYFLGVACAVVAGGPELDVSSRSSPNQLSGRGSSSLSLSVLV